MKELFNGRYAITSDGKIYSLYYNNRQASIRLDEPKRLKTAISANGYEMVRLRINGVAKGYSIHRLVAEAYLDGFTIQQINHKNGIKTDNRICNLELSSPSHNGNHSLNVLGNRRYNKINEEKLSLAVDLFSQGKLLTEIGEAVGLTFNAVSKLMSTRLAVIDSPYCEKYKLKILQGYANRRSVHAKFARECLARLEQK